MTGITGLYPGPGVYPGPGLYPGAGGTPPETPGIDPALLSGTITAATYGGSIR